MSFFSPDIDKCSPFGLSKRKPAKPTEPLSWHFSDLFHVAVSQTAAQCRPKGEYMNTTSIDNKIENIYSRFKSAGIELDKSKVRDKVNYLLGYKVPLNEAVRTVTMALRKDHNLPFESFKPDKAGLAPIASVEEDNNWVTVRGKVMQESEIMVLDILKTHKPQGALARDTIQNVLRALGYAMLDVDNILAKLKVAGEIIEPTNGFFKAV
jgi:hypothetical protein